MKILQLVTSRQFRGAEVFAATLSKELIRQGVEICFVGIYSPPKEPLAVEGAINVDIHGKKKFLSLSLIKSLVVFLRKEKPDVIQANGSDTLKYAIFARYFANRKTPIVYRNISVVSAWVGTSVLKKAFYKFLFSQVDFVTSVGEESIADLIHFFNYPKNQTLVVRRGIPSTFIEKNNARLEVVTMLQLKQDTKLVVHAGNFSAEKNHEFLVEVFSIVKKIDPNIKLLLIGDGVRFQFIADLLRQQSLNDTVFQLGFRKDINFFLSAADLFVLCSKIEGIPGVILEAGAQRTPSLAIEVGGVREVVQKDLTGVMQKGYDVQKFAETTVQLVNDRQKLNFFGENAYNFVKENFDPTRNALIFFKLYHDLIEKSKKA
jgi:L-malate glycosyltransferase